jgi:hypothetical protein
VPAYKKQTREFGELLKTVSARFTCITERIPLDHASIRTVSSRCAGTCPPCLEHNDDSVPVPLGYFKKPPGDGRPSDPASHNYDICGYRELGSRAVVGDIVGGFLPVTRRRVLVGQGNGDPSAFVHIGQPSSNASFSSQVKNEGILEIEDITR